MPISPFVPSQPKALANHPLFNDASLVSYWKLSDLTDEKGVNELTNNGTATFVQGIFDNSVSLNGTSQYLSKTSPGTVSGNFSLVTNIYPTVVNTNGKTFFGSRSSNTYGVDIKIDGASGNLNFNIGNGSAWLVNGNVSRSFTANTWYQIILTATTTGYSIYINGSLFTSGSYSGTPILCDSTHNIYIGSVNGGGEFFAGQIDDTAIFSRALSADEVKSLYGYTRAWYPLQGNSTDYSGNGNNGSDTSITYSPSPDRLSLNANFNGSSSEITVTSNASINFGTGPFTISVFVKRNTFGSYQSMVSKRVTDATGYSLYFKNDDTIIFDAFQTTSTDGTANTTRKILDSNYHHICAVREGGTTLKVYVDSILWATASVTARNVDNSNNLKVGSLRTPGDNFLNGSMRNIILENRAWSPAEIAVYYRRMTQKYPRKNWYANIVSTLKSSFFMFFHD